MKASKSLKQIANHTGFCEVISIPGGEGFIYRYPNADYTLVRDDTWFSGIKKVTKLAKDEGLFFRWRMSEIRKYKPKTNLWDMFCVVKTDELDKKYEKVLEDIKDDIEIVVELAHVLNDLRRDNAQVDKERSLKFLDLYAKLIDYVYDDNSEYTQEELRKFNDRYN